MTTAERRDDLPKMLEAIASGSQAREAGHDIALLEAARRLRTAAASPASGAAWTTNVRWAVNVLLEKIAEKFEGWDTMDIWRSDAAMIVRGFKNSDASTASGVTEERATIIDRAMHWWMGKRPFKWDEVEHLANPTINCNGERESELAAAVAAYMQPALIQGERR